MKSIIMSNVRFEYEGPLQTTTSFDEEMSEDQDLDEDVLLELTRKAAAGRVLVLLDGLDEVHGVGNLDSIRLPAGHPERPGLPGKGAITSVLQPLEFAQCLLTGKEIVKRQKTKYILLNLSYVRFTFIELPRHCDFPTTHVKPPSVQQVVSKFAEEDGVFRHSGIER